MTSIAMFLALWSVPALAADAEGSNQQPTVEEDGKRPMLFPAFKRKREREAPAEAVAVDQPAADAEVPQAQEGDMAAELPSEGIWEWVDRMEGEIPTEVQIAAIQEQQELDADELVLTADLSGGEVPTRLYTDPRSHLKVDPLFMDLVNPAEFDIPVEVTPEVEKWVQYFTGPGRKHYERWLSRSSRYRPMMYRELEAAGLPRDLVYLSMIESGYNAHAYSHAAAAGLWQFIPSTGKLYDLRIDYWVDDRRDPEASVGAAIDFLGELHKMFGDWRLAWAAYNGGPGRVRRATSQAGSKDFWVLARGSYLHSETDNYVPKIMAAAIIGHHPERYGFTGIPYQEELTYEKVKVEGSVEFDVLAKCAGTTVEQLQELNPALRRYATPPEGYEVRVPVGRTETFLAALSSVPKSELVTIVKHTVKKGETLGVIASKYGTSVSALSSANGLRNANHIYVGMSLRIPKKGYEDAPAVASSSSSSSKSAPAPKAAAAPKVSTHTVSRGETLSSVAAKHGVSVEQLKSWNKLKSSTIMVGQKLSVQGSSASSASGTSSAAVTSTHVVKKGESLGSIASKYGVSTSQLQSWNGIRDASHIEVGQKLAVKGGKASSSGGSSSASSDWKTYTVQRGDSLGKIATQHGVSVSELQSWNGIRGSVIQPGQKLKIKG